jgi:hypothetical protein
MSQITAVILGSGGAGPITTLTGNSGSAVAPSAGNINILGSGILTVTGNPGTHTLTISATNPIPIANGGTNATSMTTTDGVVYFDGTRLVTTAVGTAGQVLTSNGAGVAPTFQAGGGGGGGITTIDLDNSSSVTGSTIGLSGSDTGNETGTIYTSAGSATQINLNYFDQYNSLVMGTFGSYTTFGGNSSFVDTVAIGANILVDAVSIAGSSSNNYNENCLMGSNVLSGIGLGTPIGGNFNCAIGYNALNQLGQFAFAPGNANYNCVMGWSAGTNYTTTESNNILLNSPGVAAENNVLHIGAGTGTGSQELAAAYISGIRGVGIVGTAVLVSASDQLGIAVSSKRFKKNIDDMGNYSEDIHKLRPVTFDYKDQSFDDPMVGLIAEEVEEAMPELVVKDKEGLPLTVKYLDLIPMLLNEVQKLRKELDTLKKGV